MRPGCPLAPFQVYIGTMTTFLSRFRLPARPGSRPSGFFSPSLLGFPAALLVLFTSAEAEAQRGTSILSLLPTADRVLQVGPPEEGFLGSEDDPRMPDGAPVQAWEVRGEPGQWLWIDLVSQNFDAYLYVWDAERGELLFDDDSGGGCHARIPILLPEGGRVTAVASQVGIRNPGAFTLQASTEEPPIVEDFCAYATQFDQGGDFWLLPDDLTPIGRLEPVPGEVEGRLQAGAGPMGPVEAQLQTWEVEFRQGQVVQIDLESDTFDAVLILSGPSIDGYLVDDDGGEGLNSRLLFTVLQGGTYRLHVTGFGADAAGPYRLRVTEILPPPEPGR